MEKTDKNMEKQRKTWKSGEKYEKITWKMLNLLNIIPQSHIMNVQYNYSF